MESISIKEFARRVEISDTMIHRYIDAGKIGPDAWELNEKNGRRMILFETAFQYWAIYNEVKNLEYVLENPECLNFLELPKEEEKKNKEPKDKKPKKEKAGPSSQQLELLESERREKSAKAQLAELNLNKALGLLVNFDEVKKVLHSFGAEIRLALEAIPDREIDNIFSANDRGEAHLILTLAIKNALTALTKIEEKVVIKPSAKK
jgi:hypothetical protein